MVYVKFSSSSIKGSKVKVHHLYGATNCKLQLQRRCASQTERACSL